MEKKQIKFTPSDACWDFLTKHAGPSENPHQTVKLLMEALAAVARDRSIWAILADLDKSSVSMGVAEDQTKFGKSKTDPTARDTNS